MKQAITGKSVKLGIRAAVCPSCGTLHYPVPLVCTCGAIPSRDDTPWEEREISGTARVLTWTRLSAVPDGIKAPELTLGIVEFPDGVRAVVQMDVKHPRTGMNVDVGVEIADDGEYRQGLRFVCKEHAYA